MAKKLIYLLVTGSLLAVLMASAPAFASARTQASLDPSTQF